MALREGGVPVNGRGSSYRPDLMDRLKRSRQWPESGRSPPGVAARRHPRPLGIAVEDESCQRFRRFGYEGAISLRTKY
jgi:hypothetical protein